MRIFPLAVLISAISTIGSAQTAPPPIVRDAFVLQDKKPVRTARLSSHLEVVVCQSELEPWLKEQVPISSPVLYLNGLLIKGAVAAQPWSLPADINDERLTQVRQICAAPNAGPGTDAVQMLTFYLDPAQLTQDGSKEAWLEVLVKPWESRPVGVSAGTDKVAWPSERTVAFERLHLGWLAGWAVLFVIAAQRFLKFARASDIIRDTGSLPADTPPGTRKAFSLGRTQMAIWTFVIAPALAFIFLVTWNAGAVSNGVLILMGISFGTTLVAATQDNTSVPGPTKGFWNDLVDDGTGPSIHRFQMLIFTIILVMIFVIKTASGLVMPDFDTSLLALMGISNGTYIGFKMQGK